MHTQCPKCRTIFNVTEQILAVKAGLVRCGDCENVFNATWNLVDDDEDAKAALPEQSRIVSVRPRRRDERVEDDFPLPPRNTLPDEDDAWPPDPVREPVDSDDDDDDPAGMPEAGRSTADIDDDDDVADEFAAATESGSTARSDAADEDDKHRYERAFGPLERHPVVEHDESASAPVDLSGDFDDEDETEDEDLSDEEIRRTLRLDDAFDEHDDTVDEDDNDSEPGRPMRTRENRRAGAADQRSEPRGTATPGGRIEPRLDAAPREGLSVSADDGLVPRRRPAPATSSNSTLRRKPAIQLKAPAPPRAASAETREPRVDPNVHWVSIPDNDRRGSQFLWASGVLVLIVLVVLQIRFFLVDELYSIEGTRPYISLFCGFAGCSAPQRVEPGAIDIAQTRVDLHPEVPGAIRINVNLINRAAFAQPYPALELTLSDTDGRIVGRRTYEPADYLRERPESALLDPGILAVASINLARPNENAVGFETRVVASGDR